jgi:hypothetical protein
VCIAPSAAQDWSRFRKENMSATEWLGYLLLAFLLGTAGQLVRVGIGFKKMHDKSLATKTKIPFDHRKFWTSIVLGAMAGLITAVVKWQGSSQIDADFIFMLMAAGYAGSDIIEGLIENGLKSVPKDDA